MQKHLLILFCKSCRGNTPHVAEYRGAIDAGSVLIKKSCIHCDCWMRTHKDELRIDVYRKHNGAVSIADWKKANEIQCGD